MKKLVKTQTFDLTEMKLREKTRQKDENKQTFDLTENIKIDIEGKN